jgi:hypothetical protein
MKIQDFIQKIEELGFVEDGSITRLRGPDVDFPRSYKAPERLAAAVEWLNVSGTDLKKPDKANHSVIFQPPKEGLVDQLGLPVSWDTVLIDGVETPYRELGTALSPFCLDADEVLLEALNLDAERFLRWLYHRPIAVMELKDEEGETQDLIVRGDSIERLEPGPKQ